jgi:hypothetical protein
VKALLVKGYAAHAEGEVDVVQARGREVESTGVGAVHVPVRDRMVRQQRETQITVAGRR